MEKSLGKNKNLLTGITRHAQDFFAAAQWWQYILTAIVVFGAYAFLNGYFPNFWRWFNPLYR